jgi:hypothetical protein
MTDTSQHAQTRDPAYGWVMVFAVFLLSALAFGALGSISVFLKPLAAEFGWSRGQTSFGYTVISFSSALFGVLWGFVADRFGTRWFGLIAAFAMSGSLFALSGQDSILQFYGLYFLFGAFGNAMVTSPLFANVGFWFNQKPGLALGITASGGAVGQAVVPYLCALSLNENGWQATYMIAAACYLALALPAALLIRESPGRELARLQPQEEVREFPLSEREVIIWISVAIIFLLQLHVCAHRASGSTAHRRWSSLGRSHLGTHGADVQRCAWTYSRWQALRCDRGITQLPADVCRTDPVCGVVPLFGVHDFDLSSRSDLWFYLFRRYVHNFGVYSNDGLGQLCSPSHEYYVILWLVWHGGRRFYGRLVVRHDR